MDTKRLRADPEEKAEAHNSRALQPIEPVFADVTRFFTLTDHRQLSYSCRFFRTLCQSSSSWRALLKQHYGKVYFFYEYRLQYQAAYQLDLAKRPRLSFVWFGYHSYVDYTKLHNFINSSGTIESNWKHYFNAHINIHRAPNTTVEHALKALRAGDLRAEAFLMTFFMDITNIRFFKADHLLDFLKLLQREEYEENNYRNRCIIACLLIANTTTTVEDKIRLTNEIFTTFFDNFLYKTETALFIDFITDILQALRLIEPADRGLFKHRLIACNLKNSLEVILNTLVINRIADNYDFSQAMENWLKSLARTNATAAYVYAKHFLSKTLHHVLTKKYLIFAIEGGEYQAVPELEKLYIEKHGAVYKKERDDCLKLAARNMNPTAVDILFVEIAWDNDLVWLFVNYIMNAGDRGVSLKEQMEEKVAADRGDAPTYCALTLVYGLTRQRGEARRQFSQAIDADADIFNKFLARGRELGLCEDQHSQLIANLQREKEAALHKPLTRSSSR